jgi:hypothetical protein
MPVRNYRMKKLRSGNINPKPSYMIEDRNGNRIEFAGNDLDTAIKILRRQPNFSQLNIVETLPNGKTSIAIWGSDEIHKMRGKDMIQRHSVDSKRVRLRPTRGSRNEFNTIRGETYKDGRVVKYIVEWNDGTWNRAYDKLDLEQVISFGENDKGKTLKQVIKRGDNVLMFDKRFGDVRTPRATRGRDFQKDYIVSLENQLLRAANSLVFQMRDQIRNILAGVDSQRLSESEADNLLNYADSMISSARGELRYDIRSASRYLSIDGGDDNFLSNWGNHNPLGDERQ